MLLRHRIPYQIVGGVSFYQRREIKDIMAYLRVVQSDADAVSIVRSIQCPKRGLGDTSLQKMATLASVQGRPLLVAMRGWLQGQDLGELRLTSPQKTALREYLGLIDGLRLVAKELSLQDLLAETILRSGYLTTLKEDPETAIERKENLDELVAKASEWDEQREETEDGTQDKLESFLTELSLKGSADEASPDGDSVQLMTLHNGKGLEFRAVFLIGMEEDLFPHLNAKNAPDGIEEERRLCYVGVTRARDHLFLSAAHTRFLWGGLRSMRPSRFLQEIPAEFLRKIQERPRI